MLEYILGSILGYILGYNGKVTGIFWGNWDILGGTGIYREGQWYILGGTGIGSGAAGEQKSLWEALGESGSGTGHTGKH